MFEVATTLILQLIPAIPYLIALFILFGFISSLLFRR